MQSGTPNAASIEAPDPGERPALSASAPYIVIRGIDKSLCRLPLGTLRRQ